MDETGPRFRDSEAHNHEQERIGQPGSILA